MNTPSTTRLDSVMGWQLIESAPHVKSILACWARPNETPAFGVVEFVAGEWIENHDIVCAPTHWMPLPGPPASSPVSEEGEKL